MALVEFEDLPSTDTPINASNLNNNFDYLSRNVLTATIYSTQTVSSTNEKINLALYKSTGDKLSMSDNGVLIGSGVSKVLVSATLQAQWNSPTSNDFLIYIMKNDTLMIRVNGQKADTSISNSTTLPPILMEVDEGDIIYLYYQGSSSSSVIYGASSYLATSMTVEVVE